MYESGASMYVKKRTNIKSYSWLRREPIEE
jgi:hypothetical protein